MVAAVEDVFLEPGGKVGGAGEADGGGLLEGGGGEGEGEHDEKANCSKQGQNPRCNWKRHLS